ncbi:MAG: 50S ribosomal protein L17 [Oligoflexia bacterium]|nr:50S ribosomal protein L17 [Oligoflexia bacterium]
MRHKMYRYKIGTSAAHRRSLLRNLTVEMIEHGKIKTTLGKCRALKSFLEKMVTFAREDSIHHRRLASSRLGNNKGAVKRLFENVAPKYKGRSGGYTRIVKVPDGRVGDGAPMAYISFVE